VRQANTNMPPSGIVHIYQLDDDQTITFVRASKAVLSGKFDDCAAARTHF